MKILQINSTIIGSTGTIMRDIAEYARLQGFECITASPHIREDRNIQVRNHIYIGTRLSKKLHVLLGRFTGLHDMFSVASTLVFLNKVNRYSPDIIHLHNLHDCYINLPLLFRFIKHNKVKVIWTLHDCWAFTGHCPYYTDVGCNKWIKGCSKCPQMYSYPSSFIDTSSFLWKKKKKWFTGIDDLVIVTPSEWLKNEVESSFLKDYPITVIHNGIDLSVFKPTFKDNIRKKHDCLSKYIVLGVASDWGKRKGLDVFNLLAEQLGDDYCVILVGTNDTVDSQLHAKIISVHSTESKQELAAYYSAADVFVNPTREDNYPTVNMESIACGTPVITFDTGGSPESILSGCGSVVLCDDIDKLVKEIKRICSEKESYSRTCLESASVFNKDNKYQEYIRLYNLG